MKRTQAILNANVVENYLSYYFPEMYLTKDVEPHQIRIHVFSPTHTDEEIRNIADFLDNLRECESELEFVRNQKINILTLNVIWHIDE